MKQVLILVLCALMLCLGGCAVVNQTNSFVELPPPEATDMPKVTATPQSTQPPMVQLEVQPTLPPGTTSTPGDTSETEDVEPTTEQMEWKPTWPPEDTDESETLTQPPVSSPNGFNG